MEATHLGAWMAFFSFLPTIGEAIAVVLGLMRSNRTVSFTAMFLGKALRYGLIAGGFWLL